MDTPVSREAPGGEVEHSRGNEERSRGNEERSRGNEERSRDSEERSRDNEERSRDNEERSRDNEERSRDNEERFRDNEERSREALLQLEPGFSAASPSPQHDIQLSSPSTKPDNEAEKMEDFDDEAEENLIQPTVPRTQTVAHGIPEPTDETMRKVKPVTPLKYHKKKVSVDRNGVARCNALSRDNPFLSLYYQNVANPRTNFPDLPFYADGRAVVSTSDAELLVNIFDRNKRK